MTKRMTLRELRDKIHSGELSNHNHIIYSIDQMHDQLREETLHAFFDAVNTEGDFVEFNGVPRTLVVPHKAVEKRLRAVFDRRKRRWGP